MTDDRYQELMTNDEAVLTKDELAEGWHFCADWDGLLISHSSVEYQYCTCEAEFNERLVKAILTGSPSPD